MENEWKGREGRPVKYAIEVGGFPTADPDRPFAADMRFSGTADEAILIAVKDGRGELISNIPWRDDAGARVISVMAKAAEDFSAQCGANAAEGLGIKAEDFDSMKAGIRRIVKDYVSRAIPESGVFARCLACGAAIPSPSRGIPMSRSPSGRMPMICLKCVAIVTVWLRQLLAQKVIIVKAHGEWGTEMTVPDEKEFARAIASTIERMP